MPSNRQLSLCSSPPPTLPIQSFHLPTLPHQSLRAPHRWPTQPLCSSPTLSSPSNDPKLTDPGAIPTKFPSPNSPAPSPAPPPRSPHAIRAHFAPPRQARGRFLRRNLQLQTSHPPAGAGATTSLSYKIGIRCFPVCATFPKLASPLGSTPPPKYAVQRNPKSRTI